MLDVVMRIVMAPPIPSSKDWGRLQPCLQTHKFTTIWNHLLPGFFLYYRPYRLLLQNFLWPLLTPQRSKLVRLSPYHKILDKGGALHYGLNYFYNNFTVNIKLFRRKFINNKLFRFCYVHNFSPYYKTV
jgi:hypothetical protein